MNFKQTVLALLVIGVSYGAYVSVFGDRLFYYVTFMAISAALITLGSALYSANSKK